MESCLEELRPPRTKSLHSDFAPLATEILADIKTRRGEVQGLRGVDSEMSM